MLDKRDVTVLSSINCIIMILLVLLDNNIDSSHVVLLPPPTSLKWRTMTPLKSTSSKLGDADTLEACLSTQRVNYYFSVT